MSAVDTSKPDSGDYIPCEFSLDQLLALRPKPQVLLFGSYEQEKLRSTVIAAALSQKATPDFPEEARIQFIGFVAHDQFIGLTPSEALATVITSLDAAISNARFMANSRAQSSTGKGDASQPGTSGQPTTTAQPATIVPPAVLNQQVPAGQQGTPKQPGLTGQAGAGQAAANQQQAGTQQGTPGQAGAAGQAGAQATAIVDSARTQISAFQRPPDIGCAMSIMDWNELRYAFGQTIADQYIGVQIVVRNVNPNKEFLIHDAEISVDSDLNGRFGRFFSGQDKLSVRQFMLSSRDYGRRNFVVHLAQGVGSVMSAASLVYGPSLQAATNVFNAGFVPALQAVWTDHNTDQLNLLNDVGFSASKTDRTVVPKSGTAMFVIFIPSKQFENAWWVQSCATNVVLTPSSTSTQVSSSLVAPSNPTRTVGGGSLQSGVDLDSLRAICLESTQAKSATNSSANLAGSNSNPNTSIAPSSTGNINSANVGVQYMKPKAVHYKRWTPMANAIFNELTLAVVAGTHFTEDSANTPLILTVTCLDDELGNLDYTKANAGSLSCDLTGVALDKAQKLRLRNAENPTDAKTADGTVTTSGDATKATVKFQLAQLGILEAATYKVYVVTSAGAESGGTQILHLSAEPFVSDDPSRAELNLDQLSAAGASAATITLKGYHLDKLTSIHLGNSEKQVAASDSISIDANVKGAASASAASFEITPAQVAKLPPGNYTTDKVKLYIFVVSKDKPGTKATTGQILLASGTVKAPAPKPPATTPKKAPTPKGK